VRVRQVRAPMLYPGGMPIPRYRVHGECLSSPILLPLKIIVYFVGNITQLMGDITQLMGDITRFTTPLF
jgi:hypothetical protein